MAVNTTEDHYKGIATQYDGIEALPQSRLSEQLVQYALGDCTGQVILDVGGGSGLHARNAILKGAARVDNVDLSPEMLQNCDLAEEQAGRKPGEYVACFLGDATRPLNHLALPGRDGSGLYDIVMANWTFDHASNVDELETMWRNVAQYCRPGGKVISIRIADPWGRHPSNSKYGVEVSDLQTIPGGVKYVYTVQTNPPFRCEASSMNAHHELSQARSMAKKLGFLDLEAVPFSELKIIKEESDFWKDFLDHPNFCCAVGMRGPR
ncbi:S-adenosyl-L-methionine-dependent methyltransferase [Polychaeton citri CBS 116435]|uniref:S-adenosyl-L-methionine-dependent methyltransferase n=1 Tax=Polychaeton citri CBS 116435 TaxID=1314669 RepID=A0A9P4US30_9PEZI|nr:S-adenosyl-L-methionine-dependent methyltransferase [Polychaeton citri CBS 116435]